MRKSYMMTPADRGEQFGNTLVTDKEGLVVTDESYNAELISPSVVMVHWRMRTGNTRAGSPTRSQLMYASAMESLNVRLKEQVSGKRSYNSGEVAVALEAGNTCALVVKTLLAMKEALMDAEAGGVHAYGTTNFVTFLETLNNWIPIFQSKMNDLPVIPNFKRYLDLIGYKTNVKMGISVVSVCDEIYFRGRAYQLETSWEAATNAENLERDLQALYNALAVSDSDTAKSVEIMQAAADLLSTDKGTHFRAEVKSNLQYDHLRDNVLNAFAFYATEAVAGQADGFWKVTRAGANYNTYLASRVKDFQKTSIVQPYYVNRSQDKSELPFDKCLGTPKGAYSVTEENEGFSGYVSSWAAVAQFTAFNFGGTNYDYGTYWMYSVNSNGDIVNSGQPNRIIPLLSLLGLLPAINAVGVAISSDLLKDITANSVPLCPYDKNVINPTVNAVDNQLGVEHERWLIESFQVLDERYQHGRKDNRKLNDKKDFRGNADSKDSKDQK